MSPSCRNQCRNGRWARGLSDRRAADRMLVCPVPGGCSAICRGRCRSSPRSRSRSRSGRSAGRRPGGSCRSLREPVAPHRRPQAVGNFDRCTADMQINLRAPVETPVTHQAVHAVITAVLQYGSTARADLASPRPNTQSGTGQTCRSFLTGYRNAADAGLIPR
jgi:hypothetical protein